MGGGVANGARGKAPQAASAAPNTDAVVAPDSTAQTGRPARAAEHAEAGFADFPTKEEEEEEAIHKKRQADGHAAVEWDVDSYLPAIGDALWYTLSLAAYSAGTLATAGASVISGAATGALVGGIPGAAVGFASSSVGTVTTAALETAMLGARVGVNAVAMAANSITIGTGTVVSTEETSIVSAAPAKGEADAGGESILMSEIDVGEDNQAAPSPGTSDATNLGTAGSTRAGEDSRSTLPQPPRGPRTCTPPAGRASPVVGLGSPAFTLVLPDTPHPDAAVAAVAARGTAAGASVEPSAPPLDMLYPRLPAELPSGPPSPSAPPPPPPN